MTFETFKTDIETILANQTKFELVEFHYLPYSFGSGLLAYRIAGKFHKFVFDGRDGELSCYRTNKNDKYETENFELYRTFTGLTISTEILKDLK